MKNLKAYFAEALGTFVLVFFACGVAAWTGGEPIATSIAFGLVIVAMAYSIGRISGCHINPAVSLGCLLDNRMSLRDFFGYVIAQLIGGIAGGLALFGIAKLGGANLLGNACNSFVGNKLDVWNCVAAILMEVVLACVFVFVILNVTDSKNEGIGKKAGVLIGFTLTLVHLLGIGFTGTSVNPARSFATAFADLVYNGNVEALKVVWVFILAPLLGGALAALLFKAFQKEAKK